MPVTILAQESAAPLEPHYPRAAHRDTQKHMAPKKKADNELGSVVPKEGQFRVEVKLAGRTMIGPRRVERSIAEADLVAMRAFPRAEMPKFLSDLMAALV